MPQSSEKRRAKRAEYAVAGLCSHCGKRPPVPAGKTCQPCRDYACAAWKQLVAAGLCQKSCGRRAEPGLQQCRECLNKQADRDTATANALLCKKCKKSVTTGNKYCGKCREKQRARYQRLRDAVFAAYGGYRCCCPGCNVTEPRFLQIDHINNDGAKHRKEIGGSGAHVYGWLRRNKYPPGFQVLCANCNYAKKTGTCPHQLGREAKHVANQNVCE